MDKQLYEAGLEVRKATLGKEFVENAIASADDFNRPLQEFVTEYCWGACWTRPGLPRKTRSMLNLAMLTALNRPHELKMHIKGALVNGVTRDEIREILLQTGVYCGVPAAVDAFRTAKEVFAELDKKVNGERTLRIHRGRPHGRPDGPQSAHRRVRAHHLRHQRGGHRTAEGAGGAGGEIARRGG